MTENTPEKIGVAAELRELAAAIEQLTRNSLCCSVAWEPVIMLVEHLTLQAHVIELENKLP